MAVITEGSNKPKAGSSRTSTVPVAPTLPEPRVVIAPPTPLEKLGGKIRAWGDAREESEKDKAPAWWAYDSAYSSGVNQKAQQARLPAIPFPVEPEPKPLISRVATEPAAPLAPGGPGDVWENTWGWLTKKAEEMSRIVVDFVTGAVAEPSQVGLPRLNYLFGNPFKEGVGEAWKKAVYTGLTWPGKAAKHLVGWVYEMGITPRLGGGRVGGLDGAFKGVMLTQGTYAQAVTNQVAPAVMTDEERAAEISSAEQAQTAFTARYNELRASGQHDTSAMFQALKEVQEAEQKTAFAAPSVFGGVSTEGTPLPFSDASRAAWGAARGFRYSHATDPARDRAYHELLEQGVDPQVAGAMTEDPVVEGVGELLFDPNWVLPLDSLLIGTIWGAAKKVAGVATDIGLKIPGIRGGLQWAGELTARTQSNYAARHADEILRTIRGYADGIGEVVTPGMVEDFLRNPPPEVISRMPAYYQRALQGAAKYTDEIVAALKKVMTGTGLDEITETVTKQIAREVPNAAPAVVASRIEDAVWEVALKGASSASYVAALKAYTDAAASAHPALAKILATIKPLSNLLQGPKGVMVDTWLGLRPSWNVFNYADNLIKLLMDGVNPFSSLPEQARRYMAYAPEVTEVAGAVERLRKIRVWDLSTTSNVAYTSLLHKVAPRQSLGTFGEAMARDFPSSFLAGFPGTGAVMAWNKALAGRIEMSMRARAYYKFFFDTLDRGWTALTKRQATAIVSNLPVNLSSDVSQALVARLQAIHNPTAVTVATVFKDMLVQGKLSVVVPTLGADLVGELTSLPPEITTALQRRLNRLVSLGSQGPPTVLKADIEQIFDGVARDVAKYADDLAASARRSYMDTLPSLPKTVDEMYSVLVKSGPEATMEELFQGIDDMPLLAARANLDSQAMTAAHKAAVEVLKQAKAPIADIARVQDEFWTVTRPRFWADFTAMQEGALNKIADQVDELLTGGAIYYRGTTPGDVRRIRTGASWWDSKLFVTDTPEGARLYGSSVEALRVRSGARIVREGTPEFAKLAKGIPQGRSMLDWAQEVAQNAEVAGYDLVHFTRQTDIGTVVLNPSAVSALQTYPRELTQRYLVAVRAYTDVETEIFKTWQIIIPEVYSGRWSRAIRDEWMALGRMEADKLYKEGKVLLDAAVHDVLVQSREWFIKNGLAIEQPVSMVDLAKNVGWWRIGQQIDNIPANARRAVGPMIGELRGLRDDVLGRRTAPFKEVPLSSVDRTVLGSYAAQMESDVTGLVSDSIDGAIKGVNDTLFDYETTQNWMLALGNIFPFVRFPAKNLPMWIEKFAQVPHLVGSVAKVRAVQAAVNADLPARQRYSVPIPRELTDWFLGRLGFDNCVLRVNPWSFISIFQALPGATMFSQRRMEELGLDDGDNQVKQGIQVFAAMSEELGFRMWPYLEWAIGCWGLLGEDWYPGDALGTWAPLVDWSMREVFGFDKSFDIDRHMRNTLPKWWNTLFGDTALAWQQLNPDLMEEWVQGREIEGVLMAMPDPAIVALMEITPVQAKEVVRGMASEQVGAIRAAILPLFSATSEEQASRIPKLTLEERAVFLDEMEKVALRIAVRKQAFTTVLGNLTGLYAEPSNLGEVEATRLRLQRRIAQESMAPGAERRDFMSQWYAEHPKYQAVQTWRFSEHPWAATASGREAEIWDATVDGYKTQYYEYNAQWRTQYDAAVAETYRAHPGEVARLNELKADLRAQKQEYTDQLNARLSADITRRMEEYIAAYPTDTKGIQLLREGWDTTVYVAVALNAEEREQLAMYERTLPDDTMGYTALFQRLYEQARKRLPPTQTRRVPGLNEGIQMNLQWSPIGNANYSEEEVRRFLVQDLLEELESKAPSVEDYPTLAEGWAAYNTYLGNITEEALKTEQVQSQIATLMREQKLSKTEATEMVSTWYTEDELRGYWREWDSPWEALEYVYKWRVMTEANEHFFGEVLPLKDGDDYDLYTLAREDLNLRYGPMPAADLIKFIMVDYPGKWSQAELERLFEGVEMPGYFDRLTFQKTGAEAVDSYIWYFYNMLDSAGQRGVRTGFGALFQDSFLNGDTESLSVELRGSWLDYLSELAGQKMSWKSLPGVDLEVGKSGVKEAQLQGMPVVSPLDAKEFEQAQDLNRQYWELRLANDPAYKELGASPLYQKWFGGSSPKSYFWNLYYTQVPPGSSAEDLRNNPLVAIILTKDVRLVAATNADYDRASEVIEAWVAENAERAEGLGLDPSEFAKVRELMTAYYEIPAENKEARRQFFAENPLLSKYYAGTSGTGVSGASAAKGQFWDLYYAQVPPGPFSKDLKDNPLVAMILNPDTRTVVVAEAAYARAVGVVQAWVTANQEKMTAAGLSPEEYDQVRALIGAYYEIPAENKEARKQFLVDNPLLKKYFDAGADSTGSGGYGGGGGSGWGATTWGGSTAANSRQAWVIFRSRVGASLSTVLRMLLYYWSNGSLPGKSDAYLRKLHAELGGGLSFEDWLSALRVGWMASGTAGRISVSKVPAPPKPRYENVTRGIRR